MKFSIICFFKTTGCLCYILYIILKQKYTFVIVIIIISSRIITTEWCNVFFSEVRPAFYCEDSGWVRLPKGELEYVPATDLDEELQTKPGGPPECGWQWPVAWTTSQYNSLLLQRALLSGASAEIWFGLFTLGNMVDFPPPGSTSQIYEPVFPSQWNWVSGPGASPVQAGPLERVEPQPVRSHLGER